MTSVKNYDRRWRLTRAGVVNVWHYIDTEFTISGGRLILRGANGSGKSRALEMLLPYLLDSDRRRMDATGSNKVDLDELMRTGARGQNNRLGYLWIELYNNDVHLTIGAHIKYSTSADRSEVLFFTTDRRIGQGLTLVSPNRDVLSRDALIDVIGQENLSKTPEEHREAVRTKVFGLRGESGKDRFAGLLQLLHTLRSPDVGNRIDEGKLPQILSDALPPLSEQTLGTAGEQLDGLTETRGSQQQLESTLSVVERFHDVYGNYLATAVAESATVVLSAADDVAAARENESILAVTAEQLQVKAGSADTLRRELGSERTELTRAVDAFREHPLFRSADDLRQRDLAVAAMRHTAEQALGTARRTRIAEVNAADRLIAAHEDVRRGARTAAQALTTVLADCVVAGIDIGGLPTEIHVTERTRVTEYGTVNDSLDGFPASIARPTFVAVVTSPENLEPTAAQAESLVEAAEVRRQQAERRLQEARRLEVEHARVRESELAEEYARQDAERDDALLDDCESVRDDLAIDLDRAWRAWLSDEHTGALLPGADHDFDVDRLGQRVAAAAASMRETWAVSLDRLRAEDAADVAEDVDHDSRAAARAEARVAIRRDRRALTAHLAATPDSGELVAARHAAAAASARAQSAEARARGAQQLATTIRSAWSREVDTHEMVCAGLELPADAEHLELLLTACHVATGSLDALARACRDVVGKAAAVRRADVEFTFAGNDRVHAESAAEERRTQWHTHASTVSSAHETLEVPPAELAVELTRTLDQLAITELALGTADRAATAMAVRLAAARTDVAVAAEKSSGRIAELVSRVSEFNARVRLPGVTTEVSGLDPIVHSDDVEHVRAVAQHALTTLGTRPTVSVNDAIAALQVLQRDSSGHLEVSERVEHGVFLADIDGVGDVHDPAAVCAELRQQVTAGKLLLGRRESDVFTEFVLGGVADELRRRLRQARELVAAMNTSLGSTRTSHGIGVQLAWHLDQDEPALTRIVELLSMEAEQDRTDELITLLRSRVESLHRGDESAGYAAHLADALDYRAWHAVEVTILGPEPDQQRRISKRAKISQGETRFVSYAALFAAADGYLSSLPDADTALRLVLLDDAFAKIDENTIGQLMGLLVRLDIDFVMTGHALWGTVPEVPELDIYEIRRLGDSAVITTRVHWDGKQKHLHALG